MQGRRSMRSRREDDDVDAAGGAAPESAALRSGRGRDVRAARSRGHRGASRAVEASVDPRSPAGRVRHADAQRGRRPLRRPRLVFVDTAAFRALYDAADGNHDAARATWEALVGEGARLFTSELIVAETLAGFSRPADARSKRYAVSVGRRLYEARELREIIRVEPSHAIAALDRLERFADHPKLGFVDCTTFAVMADRGIRTAFTFDARDFAAAGFDVIP